MQTASKLEQRSSVGAIASDLSLSTLLSQALVAFTIEFDNEFEHQMPHRTTKFGLKGGSHDGPWLVSLVMWSNCMQWVGEEGVGVGELEYLARTKTNLDGMVRWGYIVVEPDAAESRSKRLAANWMIRATLKGRRAQEIWRPLFAVIEKRWEARFGKNEIDQLRELLRALISEMDPELPDCLPILQYGLFSRGPSHKRGAPATDRKSIPEKSLPALLSRVLLAFAIEFERESDLSLAISANVLRVLDEKGTRITDLRLLTGISKEAISMALGVLQKRGAVVIEPDLSGGRGKTARLTPEGRRAQDAYRELLAVIEKRWPARFGKNKIRTLRSVLESLVGEPVTQPSPLFRGLEPYPGGWRASVRKPNVLPYYPMVLHREAFRMAVEEIEVARSCTVCGNDI